jgi:hypothetical protein
VQRALWRFDRSVGLEGVGRQRSTRSLWLGGRNGGRVRPVIGR